MKRRNATLSGIILGVFFLVFTMIPFSVDAKNVILKLSHQWPQDTEDYVVKTAIRFAEEVNKRSNGSIKINFYPGQSLVKAKEQFKAMRDGIIDLSVYPTIYAAREIPELNIVLVPWANSHDNFFKFGHSKVWDYLEKKMNKMGVKSLSWIQIAGGIASKNKLIRKPEDVKGIKIRAGGKYCQMTYQNAGAGIVGMASSEIYTAMQRGLLDAVQTSSSSFGAFKLYEVSNYYLSPEEYSNYFTSEPISISMKTWKKLTPEQQKIMSEVGKEMETWALNEAKAEDARVAKLFADNGSVVEKMTADDYAKWRPLMEKAMEEFKKKVPNGEWLVEETLKIYK